MQRLIKIFNLECVKYSCEADTLWQVGAASQIRVNLKKFQLLEDKVWKVKFLVGICENSLDGACENSLMVLVKIPCWPKSKFLVYARENSQMC